MKGKAVILLCCALAYMAGWMAAPRMMEPVRKNCCAKTQEGKGGRHCQKEDKKNGDCTDCGISCPMCYTMIMPATILEDVAMIVASRSYPECHSTYQYGFHPDAWKPPNGV